MGTPIQGTEGLLSESDQQELKKLLVQKAINYHKTVEGEYGCNGETCPGVQRLVVLLEQWTTIVLALLEPNPNYGSRN